MAVAANDGHAAPLGLLQYGGDFIGGDALDVYLGDGQFEGAFAAETFFERRGIEGDLAALLGHGEANGTEVGGDGFWFVAIGIALAQGGAFVELGLENFGAFEFHRVVQEDAKGFRQSFQTVGGQLLSCRATVHQFDWFCGCLKPVAAYDARQSAWPLRRIIAGH